MPRHILGIFVLAAVLSAGAGSAAEQPVAQFDYSKLDGRKYTLVIADGEAVAFQKPSFIEFRPSAMVSGVVCNNFTGAGQIAGNILVVPNAVSTRMLCVDPKQGEFEAKLLRMLGGGVRMALAGDTLTLDSPEGWVVYREQPSPIAAPVTFDDLKNKTFTVSKVDGEAFAAQNQPTIAFMPDGMVAGRVCNSFRGRGTIENGILTVAEAASTMMLCANPDLNQLERDFHAMLGQGAAVTYADGKLTLTGMGLSIEYIPAPL